MPYNHSNCWWRNIYKQPPSLPLSLSAYDANSFFDYALSYSLKFNVMFIVIILFAVA